MKVEVITVGGEILSGLIADSNFAYLSRELTGIGAEVCWHATVRDEVADLVEACRTALERADVVIVTGGLGSTPDDVTRKALARVLGRELVLNDKVLEHLKDKMKALGRDFPTVMESQALIPRGASIFFNPVGTAPAFAVTSGNVRVWVLPGVPAELEAIARANLVPEVEGGLGESRTAGALIRTIGLSETVIAQRIGDLTKLSCAISYLPQRCGVDVRLSAKGSDHGDALANLEFCRSEALSRLGDSVYCDGTQSLERIVHGIILARGMKIAVAESCTGGMLSFMLMSEPGSSAYFDRGLVTYSDESKRDVLGVPPATLDSFGAVSRQTAEAMAQGVRLKAGVDLGVSTTGVAGPEGGRPGKPVGLVYVGLATPSGTRVKEVKLFGPRHQVIYRACCFALDTIRRELATA
jgi:nicotinamide-nucleotide amidase